MKQIANKLSSLLPIPAQLFCLGCLSGLATAPVYFWPLMMIGYTALVIHLIQSPKPKISALYGFLFFLGFFTTSLYWISNSLFVEFDKWWWALPLSLFGLPALLSLFPSICIYIASHISKFRWLWFTLALFVADIARATLLTGFPWNMPIHTMVHTDIVKTFLPIIGFYGLNTVIVILFSLSAIFTNKNYISLCTFIAIIGFYPHIFPLHKETHAPVGHDIHLIQLNIAQNDKWNRDLMWDHFTSYIHESEQAVKGASKPQLIFWPETAISYDFVTHPTPRKKLLALLQSLPEQSFLITGTLIFKDKKPHNSIIVLNRDGEIVHQYDKHHLVPFGEYMPFGLETITGFYNFTKGQKPKSLTINEDLSFLPLICYEIIFPQYSYATQKNDQFILNLTNDAWFGHSAGPFQHFDHAILRAIENQKTLIRLSGNGISGIITTNGYILVHSNINLKDTLTFKKENFQ